MKRAFQGIIFLVGIVLFFDELWMLGIPLGHILPDMSDFHIEGLHHWMLGLFLMILSGISVIYSTLSQLNEKKWNYEIESE
ncbi:MAG: hypothetical protein ACFFE8_05185 [Candidatus Heimdallarchaeota archaeon]